MLHKGFIIRLINLLFCVFNNQYLHQWGQESQKVTNSLDFVLQEKMRPRGRWHLFGKSSVPLEGGL